MNLSPAEVRLVEAYRKLPDDWHSEADHYLTHNEAALALELWVCALLELSAWFREVSCLQLK